MDVALYIFVAVAFLMLWYRILKGLWDSHTRRRWAASMKKSWNQVK